MQALEIRRSAGLFAASVVASAALAALCIAPRVSEAQALRRFALRGEVGGGSMLPQYQVGELRQGALVEGTLRLAVTLDEPLVLQLSFGSWYFPGPNSGQVYTVTGGLRFEPRVRDLGRFFIDANVGLGQTAELSRLAFDVGVGFEFDVTRFAAIGPFARYGRVFHGQGDVPVDAQYLAFGLSLTLRAPPPAPLPPPPPEAPRDTDNDGVLDRDDLCVNEPAGASPDPARRGCPVRDGDGDGVSDADDLCVTEPAGDHPDPARRGCPLADTDHDGVFDPDDRCPTAAAGEHPDPERAGCPDVDDDNDGVLNHADQCRSQPAGLHPDPQRPGCPAPDRDVDSVPDATDACPDRPGAPSINPRRNGCPGLVLLEAGGIRILQPVFFATNSDRILPRSLRVLQAVSDALRATPEVRRMTIDGHTDDVGDDARNMELSQRRANSVMAWLNAHGIEPGRLEAHGYGESRPVVQGTTRAARATNRRVEFRIIDPATAPATAPAP